MTIENTLIKIGELIIKRREAHGNEAEQKRLSEKLEKLYDIYYIALKQEAEKKEVKK